MTSLNAKQFLLLRNNKSTLLIRLQEQIQVHVPYLLYRHDL